MRHPEFHAAQTHDGKLGHLEFPQVLCEDEIARRDTAALARRVRRDWAATPELREMYRKFRPNVQRVISQISRRGGRRLKHRYRGTEKNHAWLTRLTDPASRNAQQPVPEPVFQRPPNRRVTR